MLGVYFCRFSKVRIVCSRTWLGWFKKGHLFINAVYHTLKLNRQKRKWLWSQWATLKTNTSGLSSLLESLKYNSLRLTHSEILSLNSQQQNSQRRKNQLPMTLFIPCLFAWFMIFIFMKISGVTLRSEIQESAYFFIFILNVTVHL